MDNIQYNGSKGYFQLYTSGMSYNEGIFVFSTYERSNNKTMSHLFWVGQKNITFVQLTLVKVPCHMSDKHSTTCYVCIGATQWVVIDSIHLMCIF